MPIVKTVRTSRYTLMLGDCLERMNEIEPGSVDMVMADPPYGTTNCKWDSVIPLDTMWKSLTSILSPLATIVFTSTQPFTTEVISSNKDEFKYCWVWKKSRPTGAMHAKNKPMRIHEDIIVFSKGTTVHKSQSKTRMVYNPQGLREVDRIDYRPSRASENWNSIVGGLRPSHKKSWRVTQEGYPNTVLEIPSVHNVNANHPTEKPVALMEYLIKTYTNEGDLVLDFVMGSGTTGVACMNLNRRFIGIEIEPEYYLTAKERIANAYRP